MTVADCGGGQIGKTEARPHSRTLRSDARGADGGAVGGVVGLPRQVKPSRAIAETCSFLAKSTDVDLRERCAGRAATAAPGRLWHRGTHQDRPSSLPTSTATCESSALGRTAGLIVGGRSGATGNRVPAVAAPGRRAARASTAAGCAIAHTARAKRVPAARSAREMRVSVFRQRYSCLSNRPAWLHLPRSPTALPLPLCVGAKRPTARSDLSSPDQRSPSVRRHDRTSPTAPHSGNGEAPPDPDS